MARQATRLWAQCPPPGALISLAGAVGAAAAVTPDLSADSCGRSFEALCDPPYRPTGGNAARNLFALLKPQRSQSPPAWRWSNPSIASQDPIDAALVPPLKRSRDVRHTLTALPALPQLSLLFRREPGPCMPLHSHTSSSAKIRRCCVDSLNSPPKADIARRLLFVRFEGQNGHASARWPVRQMESSSRSIGCQRALSVPFSIKSTDTADGASSFSKARKKILLARSTVTSTWRSAELRIKLRSVSLSHFFRNVRALS